MTDFNWWTELTHGGIFISNPVLHESFDEKFVESWHWRYKRLRDHYNTYYSKLESYRTGTHPIHSWITNIFEDFLGHESKHWLKGNSIPLNLSTITSAGITIKPTRVLVDDNNSPLLLLKRDDAPRLGMHKGRRSYTNFVTLLRKTHTQLGILTNGMQIRLVYAGLDHDAWVQWQVDAWFDEGETRHQLDGLLTLLNPDNFRVEGESFKLLDAVITSRNRQADLADVLGGQIRRAVELLTAAIGRNQQQNTDFLDPIQITPGTESILSETDTLNAVYQSATRLVMRKVVLFYAEAKELLPNSNPFYHNNYSLEGLYAQLLAAVQHTGDEELKTHYSAWQRFLALSKMVHQGSEHEVLPLKAYGGTLFRPGASGSSDPVLRALSLFERPNLGISDFEVYQILRLIKIGKTKVRQGRRSTYVSGPVDFGDLRTEYIGMMYEGLLDYELKRVGASDPRVILNIGDQPILSLSLIEPMDERAIKNLFKKMKVESDGGGSDSAESDEFETVDVSSDNPETIFDSTTYGRVLQWGVRAVEIGGLISRPRGAAAQEVYREKILAKARSLIVQVLEPGEMYLARWGGTRKGSGTFYTKPSLAVPTTQRTLAPLVYDIDGDEDGVKEPKTILDLRICDPSVGSGTFLVAAARYLTEALYESVLVHTLKKRDEAGNVVVRPKDSIILSKDLRFEAPPIKSTEDGWEDQMKARLKRLVVEHCLFGVDLNGMAVELARLALWLETMDKDLPFEFLDHRIKQGNSLVGTWFSQYLNYPVKAWERQDGTGSTKRNREILKDTIKPELLSFITGSLQYNLLEKVESPEITLDRQLEYWTELENTQLFDTEKREEIYRNKIEEDVDYLRLKHQFDRWCAVWFWPSENEKYPILSPKNMFIDDDRISDVVKDIQSRNNFFHWELEFPEVFTKYSGHLETGFDSILGNPPWDIQKPNSQEFFSNFDPIYRTYGKQEAIRKQAAMFAESENVEIDWQAYNGYFKAMSNYVRNASDPYSTTLARGRANDELKQQWKQKRDKQSYQHCKSSPYDIQGGADLNLYKLFLEQSFHLMKPEGRLGMIVPSGIYTDMGSTDLRKTFLEKSNWEWLFAFENKEKIFDIHRSSKFGPMILSKGGSSKAIKCAFMRHDVKDWESPNPPHMEIPVEKIKRFSPNTLSFMEFTRPMDLEICENIYGDKPLLGDQVEGGWNVRFIREFDVTNDSHLFTKRAKLETLGLISEEEDARDPRVRVRLWKNGYVPLYKGEYIWHYITDRAGGNDYKHFIKVEIAKAKYESKGLSHGKKIIFRKLGQSTNERNAIAAIIPSYIGTGNSVGILDSDFPQEFILLYNSLVFDFCLRLKIDKNINETFLSACPVLLPVEIRKVLKRAARFNDLINGNPSPGIYSLRLRVELDAIIAYLYNLNVDIVEGLVNHFKLVDRNLPVKQRQTTLTLEAFKHLKQVGLDRFLKEGWEIPDYITDHDRPGIKIWEPEGGWEKALEESRALLTEEEWKEFNGATLSGDGTRDSAKEEESAQQGLF